MTLVSWESSSGGSERLRDATVSGSLRAPLLLAIALSACDVHVQRAGDSAVRSGATVAAGKESSADSGASGTRADTTARATAVRIVRHDVIARGTHGMTARVRWLRSPDHLELLLVEDPVAVEADPVPNGVIYASERRGTLLQIEDVWDASPSPDWRWLAYGQAVMLRGEHRDSAAAMQWGPVARRLVQLTPGLDQARESSLRSEYEAELRAGSFPVSGMTYAFGTALTRIVRLDALPVGARTIADTVAPPRVGGWRVRWLYGDTLAIGLRPTRSQDDAPASRWDLVLPLGNDRMSSTIRVTSDSGKLAPLDWTLGPTLDITVAPDTGGARGILAGAARIENRGGTIYRTRAGERAPTAIGPGLALAATANGRFIAAIAPRQSAAAHESPMIAVMYEVLP